MLLGLANMYNVKWNKQCSKMIYLEKKVENFNVVVPFRYLIQCKISC